MSGHVFDWFINLLFHKFLPITGANLAFYFKAFFKKKEFAMKSLRARVNAGYGMRLVAAISLLWAAALGQATPDSVAIPEPSILVLLGAGVIALFISRRRK